MSVFAFAQAGWLAAVLASSGLALAQPAPARSAAPGQSEYPASSPGLDRPSAQVVRGPSGVYHEQYNPGLPPADMTVDLRPTTFWANEGGPYPGDKPLPPLPAGPIDRDTKSTAELYPLNARPVAEGFWLVGGAVIGRQHRELPWAFMKQLYDGDGLRFEASGWATITVHGLRVDNVEDGVSPRFAAGTDPAQVYWKVHQCYFRYIRDDVIENDALLSGEISDCLIDGTFIFLSQRPGVRSTTTRPDAVTKVTDCLVHLQRMPYGSDIGGAPAAPGSLVNGKGHGQPFKFKGPGSGGIEIRNTVFLIEGLSVNGPQSMSFPNWDGCVFKNVVVVWRGGGSYPGALPASGVTVTDDYGVWTRARSAWLAAHPGATAGL